MLSMGATSAQLLQPIRLLQHRRPRYRAGCVMGNLIARGCGKSSSRSCEYGTGLRGLVVKTAGDAGVDIVYGERIHLRSDRNELLFDCHRHQGVPTLTRRSSSPSIGQAICSRPRLHRCGREHGCISSAAAPPIIPASLMPAAPRLEGTIWHQPVDDFIKRLDPPAWI